MCQRLFTLFLICLFSTPEHTENTEYGNLVQDTIDLAEHGNAQAQFSLAMMYDEGNLIPRDHRQAVFWLTKSAEQNVPAACLYLGMKYEFGNSVGQDKKMAEKWYGQAAIQGWAMAQYLLAMLYLEDEKDRDKRIIAAAWLHMASERHYPGAAEKHQETVHSLNAAETVRLSTIYNNLVDQMKNVPPLNE